MISGHCEFDFIILVDSSGSVTYDAAIGKTVLERWDQVLYMVRYLIAIIDSYSTIGVTSRVAIINYSINVTTVVDLSDKLSKDQLIAVIDSGGIEYQKSTTYTYAAMQLATDMLSTNARHVSGRISATQAVILFTDGHASDIPKGYTNTSEICPDLVPSLNCNALLRAQAEVQYLKFVHDVFYALMDKGVHVIMVG